MNVFTRLMFEGDAGVVAGARAGVVGVVFIVQAWNWRGRDTCGRLRN